MSSNLSENWALASIVERGRGEELISKKPILIYPFAFLSVSFGSNPFRFILLFHHRELNLFRLALADSLVGFGKSIIFELGRGGPRNCQKRAH